MARKEGFFRSPRGMSKKRKMKAQRRVAIIIFLPKQAQKRVKA